jgi:hypothetical protein
MSLSKEQRQEISDLLIVKIENKLKKYARETTSMPFLSRLVQDSEKVAAYSFIHSIATTLGMSIYEEVSLIIAKNSAKESFTKYGIGGVLSKDQKSTISNIIRDLRNGTRKADIKKETKEILSASADDGSYHKDGNVVDFYMFRDGIEQYFEIKTVKPNIDVFVKSKTKLLEWVAKKRKPVRVVLAFPYNPYAPEPYERFTIQNMMDHPNDFLVGEEYWDYLGGKDTYRDLLNVFDTVGKDYKEKILEKIKQVAEIKVSDDKNI